MIGCNRGRLDATENDWMQQIIIGGNRVIELSQLGKGEANISGVETGGRLQ